MVGIALYDRHKKNQQSKVAIEALREVTSAPEDEDCLICLMEYGGGEGKEMSCKHMYHKDCIHKWLGVNATCSVYQYHTPIGDDDYDHDSTTKEWVIERFSEGGRA
ncbi:Zinc finger, RING/FYVE/PHD-type [Artemisia annua]|uniref:RING-type E3 ubiquitin transferase n=1 Tax=Artemisia annua TaxID=35608 RepID=A0A2U1L796_ARTAN|nr:Zinc finger, RING/FYVE/PHD-type [Artemisia annua]